MLYAVVFIVIFLIILAVWIIRVSVNARQRAQLRHHQPSNPYNAEAGISQIQQLPARPTFRGTAQDVGTRLFGQGNTTRDGEEFIPFYRPDSNIHTSHAEANMRESGRGRASGGGGGVNRNQDGEGEADPELPSYHDTTTISVPPAAYSSPIQSRREGRTMMQSSDEPPKYDASNALSATSAPPIVRRI